jgi:hypothetical protein
MSHFTTLKTQITDARALEAALADLGFPEVEVHAVAQHLYGYQGDARPQTAEVIVRRQHLGKLSNDIGFKRNAAGTFDAIISEFDRPKYSAEWLGKLAQRYAYHVARAKLQEQGFTLVAEENTRDGRIHLTLRRMA